MDLKIAWSPEAVEDIESIAEYIARDSEYYARAIVKEILNVTNSIIDYPMVGRVVPEIGKEQIRERFIYSYRLVYKVEEERILILAVIHGKRLLENIEGRLKNNTQ